MSPESQTPETIFAQAIVIAEVEDRAAFLDRACAHDSVLRSEIEKLVKDHFRAGDFLERPAPSPDVTGDDPVRERPGTVIGPYKLLAQIGEGGMGTVFMAEQTKPVERRVALKVIKPGMDSNKVIARFEAERQALALMDHPNIAKVLDAGTTDAGRPYFVMELVKGVPITEYCDENHLTVRQRLGLLLPVCQAVQHAHQKGIIHRDIKPSNVMITLYDGRPVPKVIDFGVAKATGSRLTDKTVVTEFGQVVGTLEYMSPEQAELNQLDVDTRSDIYSLGVLLYELLTGTTPLERKRLQSAAFGELLRIIREEEPPKPSTRLSTAHGLASIAANRGSEPKQLNGLVRGELDWIVMKALEKDRNRRYETANGLAMDISRYLADEAVQACPPSATYRFGKFARRHRAAIASALFVSVALVVGTVVSTWQAVRATRAEDLAEARLVTETEARAAEAQQREIAEANLQQAKAAVDEYFTAISESEVLDTLGMEPLREQLLGSAVQYYQMFVAEHGNDPALRAELAAAHIRLGRVYAQMQSNQWIDELQHVVEIVEPLVNQGADTSGWKSLREGELFKTYRNEGTRENDAPKVMLVAKRAIPVWEKLAKDHPDVPGFACDLAGLQMIYATGLKDTGSPSTMQIPIFQQAVANWQRFPAQVKGTGRQLMLANASRILAGLHSLDGNWEDAYRYASLATETLQVFPWQALAKVNYVGELKAAYSELGKAAIALDRREEARQVLHRVGNIDEQSAPAHFLLAYAFERLNDLDNALAEFTRAIELERNNADRYGLLMGRGYVQRKMGRQEEAEADFRAAVDVCSQLLQESPAGDWKYRYLRARAYAELHLHDQALADVGYGPKDPGKFKPYHMQTRAEILFDAHRFVQAADDLERALKSTPADDKDSLSMLHGTRGSALVELKRYDQATEEFTRAIELQPDRLENWLRRGWVASVQGRYDDAQKDFEDAVGRNQSNTLALRRLAWFLATCPEKKYCDAARALALAEKAVLFSPHSGEFWYTLGICQYRAGNYDEALKACQRAFDMREQPYSPTGDRRVATDYDRDAGFFLAMSQWHLGDKAKARETFDAAVAWTNEYASDDEQLARFQDEAAELLGVETPPPEKQD